jgi:hypothetical protein
VLALQEVGGAEVVDLSHLIVVEQQPTDSAR